MDIQTGGMLPLATGHLPHSFSTPSCSRQQNIWHWFRKRREWWWCLVCQCLHRYVAIDVFQMITQYLYKCMYFIDMSKCQFIACSFTFSWISLLTFPIKSSGPRSTYGLEIDLFLFFTLRSWFHIIHAYAHSLRGRTVMTDRLENWRMELSFRWSKPKIVQSMDPQLTENSVGIPDFEHCMM